MPGSSNAARHCGHASGSTRRYMARPCTGAILSLGETWLWAANRRARGSRISRCRAMAYSMSARLDVRPGAFIHAVARALATPAPSSWLNRVEIVRLASRVFPECLVAAEVAFLIWGRIEGVLVVRKQTLVGLALVGAIYTSISATTPASAGWCDCGYRAYDYFAPRVYSRMYSYAYTPLLYRDFRPAYFYGASFYRPRVWGWRSWGGRHWGWSGRRHWGWRGGWSGRHWGRRW